MKTHTLSLRSRLELALAAGERYFGPLPGSRAKQRASVYQEMRLGAAVGLAACPFYAWLGGAPALLILPAALAGLCIGGVIGLLLWSSVDDLPTAPVLPPAPGQERLPRGKLA